MQEYGKNTTGMLVKAVGEIIKKHRLGQNKTIYRISAECSIHKDTWRLIEKGLVNDIKISSLWKIAEGLDLDPIDLLKEVKTVLGKDFNISGLS